MRQLKITKSITNRESASLDKYLQEIGRDYHRGYLIHKDKTYDTMENNEQIADMIARRVMEACRE